MAANLDLVHSIFADWERGDFGRADWADTSIEIEVVGGPQPGKWTGFAGMAKVARGIFDVWEGYRVQAEGYRNLDNERVLVLVRNSGRGKTSGMELGELPTKAANLFHLRTGKVVRFVLYWDRDRALAALGLEQ
jgi:ketosteroid isomerase-like protein